MNEEEYCENIKQCFFINVFNAMILFKLTELSVFKSTKLFEMQNYSSFVALMHNT